MNDGLTSFERIARLAGSISSSREEVTEPSEHSFDQRNIHDDIAKVARPLFDDGHFAQATFEAFKCLEIRVRQLSLCSEIGYSLMMKVFSEQAPKIKLNALSTVGEKDEQMGYKHIFAGAMSAIRNPRGHQHFVDTIDLCLDHLSLVSILMRRLETIIP